MSLRSREKGNVLFLILIAVALFATLSYAVTQSSRSGGGNADAEKSILLAAQETQIGASLEQAILRMRISHGCAVEQISFDNNNDTSISIDGTPFNYYNPNSPTNGACNVFDPSGGGAIPPLFRQDGKVDPALVACPGCMAPTSWFVSATRVVGMGTDNGAAGTDLLLWMGRPTREQCLTINEKLGVDNPGGEPPSDTFDCADDPYDGTITACLDPLGDTEPAIRGQKEFCVHWGTAWGMENYLHFYVLQER